MGGGGTGLWVPLIERIEKDSAARGSFGCAGFERGRARGEGGGRGRIGDRGRSWLKDCGLLAGATWLQISCIFPSLLPLNFH